MWIWSIIFNQLQTWFEGIEMCNTFVFRWIQSIISTFIYEAFWTDRCEWRGKWLPNIICRLNAEIKLLERITEPPPLSHQDSYHFLTIADDCETTGEKKRNTQKYSWEFKKEEFKGEILNLSKLLSYTKRDLINAIVPLLDKTSKVLLFYDRGLSSNKF